MACDQCQSQHQQIAYVQFIGTRHRYNRVCVCKQNTAYNNNIYASEERRKASLLLPFAAVDPRTLARRSCGGYATQTAVPRPLAPGRSAIDTDILISTTLRDIASLTKTGKKKRENGSDYDRTRHGFSTRPADKIVKGRRREDKPYKRIRNMWRRPREIKSYSNDGVNMRWLNRGPLNFPRY